MPAKKKSSGSNSKRKQQEIEEALRKQNRREIGGVCFIAVALFFAVSIYSDAVGLLGIFISEVFFGMFGAIGYAVPIVLFAAGILLIVFSKRTASSTVSLLYVLGFIAICAMLHVYFYSGIEGNTFVEYCRTAFANGIEAKAGGGVFGAVLAYPSILFMGVPGSYILYSCLIIVTILFVTKLSLRDAGEKMGKSIKQSVDTAWELIEEQRTTKSGNLYTEDLYEELPTTNKKSVNQEMVTPEKKPEKKKKRDLDRKATPIKDLKKVKYAKDELEFLPLSGSINKRRTADSGHLVETFSAGPEVTPPAVTALRPEKRGAADADDTPDFSLDIDSLLNDMAEPFEANETEEGAPDLMAFGAKESSVSARNRITANAPKDTVRPFRSTAKDEEPSNTSEKGSAAGDMQLQKAALRYMRPPITLLKAPPKGRYSQESPEAKGKLLLETLRSFNIEAKLINTSIGPVITRFELQPAQGIRVNRITTLSNDIALALAAPRVRIEAPIPGKAAIGIEIPNKNVTGVYLREIIASNEFQSQTSPISFALGKDIAGKILCADLDKMPHLLIAGSTGSGKSVCINDIIVSMIYRSSPQDLQMILIDPKVVEMKVYANLPHLAIPVVTEPKRAAAALKSAVVEMEQRYRLMSEVNARDLKRFNALVKTEEEKLPQLVIIIDELADLMMVAAKDVEESICRIAQLGRACGIHLIVATQRPSADIITGLIKANIPSRIAFMVSSAIDSRVIMDTNGAEKLLGKGDMLFHANGASKPIRAQGAFISDEEVEAVMDFFAEQQLSPKFEKTGFAEIVTSTEQQVATQGNGKQEDDLLPEAVKIVLESGQASISMIQRRLRVGYARAARLVDIMEKHKIVSGFDGSKPRKLLIGSYAEFEAMCGAGEMEEAE